MTSIYRVTYVIFLAFVAGCYSETLLDAVQSLIPEKEGKPSISNAIDSLTSGENAPGELLRYISRIYISKFGSSYLALKNFAEATVDSKSTSLH